MTYKNLALGAAARGAALIVIVLTSVVATRTLEPSAVAQVMIAISVGTMVGVVGQAGLPWAISFRIAQLRAGRAGVQLLRENLRSAGLYLLALAGLLGVLSLAPWGFQPTWIIPNGSRSLLLAAGLTGVGRAASRVTSEVNKGFGDVNVAVIGSDLVGPAAGLLVVVGMGLAVNDLTTTEAFVWALAAGWLMAVAFTLWRSPVKPTMRRSRTHGENRLRHGMVALGVISVLNVGIQQTHIIISGYTLGLADAGIFTTASRLATLVGAPLMIIAALASPDLGVALQTGDRAQLKPVEARLQRFTGAFFVAGAALCLVYLVAGSALLSWLFGAEYAAGHAELVILSLGPLVSLFAGVAGLALMLGGERLRLLKDTVLGSTVAVASMLVGAVYGEGVGLAIGYTVGQIVINLLLLRSCRRALGLTPIANPLALVKRL